MSVHYILNLITFFYITQGHLSENLLPEAQVVNLDNVALEMNTEDSIPANSGLATPSLNPTSDSNTKAMEISPTLSEIVDLAAEKADVSEDVNGENGINEIFSSENNAEFGGENCPCWCHNGKQKDDETSHCMHCSITVSNLQNALTYYYF